jgi:hypothetical protein
LSANKARYAGALSTSLAQMDAVRGTGFSEADECAGRFRAALGPLGSLRGFVEGLLAAMGIQGAAGGVRGVLQAFFAVAPPSRITGLARPIFTAARDRFRSLLNSILAPIKQAVTRLQGLIDAVDLQPLRDSVESVVTEVKHQIDSLRPSVVLKDPLDAFKALQADLLSFDPLGDILHILDALRDAAARVLGKLDSQKILATPLAIYDHVMGELGRLHLDGLLQPVLDQLDQIAAQVDTGLTETVQAFEKLQRSLPSADGGGGGGGSLSGSISA